MSIKEILAEGAKKRLMEERAKLPEYDARVSKLPDVFQYQIALRRLFKGFREGSEGLTIYCSENAVKLAERFCIEAGRELSKPKYSIPSKQLAIEKIFKWEAETSYKERCETLGDEDYMAIAGDYVPQLARLYLKKPKAVFDRRLIEPQANRRGFSLSVSEDQFEQIMGMANAGEDPKKVLEAVRLMTRTN
jgi:hypothetical protein